MSRWGLAWIAAVSAMMWAPPMYSTILSVVVLWIALHVGTRAGVQWMRDRALLPEPGEPS